jgi:predicted ATPase/class 3 adenylate cyclase
VDEPEGTVTLLFTDIEGSTRLLLRLGDRYPEALATHRALLRRVFAAHDGQEVDTQGDAFFVAFSSALQAVLAAAEAQRALAAYPWPEQLRVRMGIHTGEPVRSAEGYVGLDVHRAARICSAGHGGQVLLSAATASLVRTALPDGIALHDLGEHRLKDLQQLEHLTQLELVGLPSDFPPPRTLDSRSNNLPIPATPLTGREREVETLVGLLRRPETRLVTLTGPGGIGKTRLAIRVASDLLHEFGGVFFVDLSPLQEGSRILSTLAQTLRVQETGGRTLEEGVLHALLERAILLVLDNFEHLLPEAEGLVQLLSACPALKLLVTSRAALRLSAEREFVLTPLALPSAGPEPSVNALRDYAAVALFVERAIAVRPDFQLTHENAGTVAEICRQLDGLPLALELAAARILVLPPEALLLRLDHRLRLLTRGARDLPERQRTLRATIAWSYDLLDPAEQAYFRRLAVFAGGATLEASDAVCNPDGALGESMDLLGALIDKSLLQRRDGPDGEPRFTMLATIREFALEALIQSGDAETVDRRYARYFVAVAESAAGVLLSGAWKQTLQRLDTERDNLQAVFGSAIDRGDGEVALRLVGALRFWYPRRMLRDGRIQAEHALALAGPTQEAPQRARALDTLGLLAWYQADYRAARAAWKQSSEIWRALAAQKELSWTLTAISTVYPDTAPAITALLDEGLSLARRAGDPWTLAYTLYWAGYRAIGRGDLPTARAALEDAAALLRPLGEPVLLSSVLYDLGRALEREGQDRMARAAFEEALGLARGAEEVADITRSLAGLGNLALRADDDTGAAHHALEGLHLSQAIDWRWGTFDNLAVLAVVAMRDDTAERTVKTFGALDALRRQVSAPWQEVQSQVIDAARSSLGEETFDSLWTQAAQTPLEQAIAAVLKAASRAVARP